MLTEGRAWLQAVAGPPVPRGADNGVQIIQKGESMAEAKKAPDDGIYTWNGRQYRAKAGTLMPPGAEFRAMRPADMTDAEKAKAESRHARRAALTPIPGQVLTGGPDEQTAKAIDELRRQNAALQTQLAELAAKLDAAPADPKKSGKGPAETTQGAGPAETS